jgi:hypothetical protein
MVSGSTMPLLDRIVCTSTPNVSAMPASVSPAWTSYVRVLGTALAASSDGRLTSPPTVAAD